MTPQLLDHCAGAAFAGTLLFPEIVMKMTADGVEWYSANLILGTTTHYGADLAHHQTSWPDWITPDIGAAFLQDAVIAAIRASQGREIFYPGFLRLIAAAGVVYYTVHLHGRKAIYFGRDGEFHVEAFPKI